MNNENNQNNFQQPMYDPNMQMPQQQPMYDPNMQMQQQAYNPNAQMMQQQPMYDPNMQMMQQQAYDSNMQMMQQQAYDPNVQMMQQQAYDSNAQMMQQQAYDPNMQMMQQQMNPNGQPMPPQQPQQQPEPDTSQELEKTRGIGGIGVIIPIILFAVLAVGGYFGYMIFFNNKTIVEAELQTLLKAADMGIDAALRNTATINSSNDVVGFNGTLVIDSNYNVEGVDLTKLKNYKINYEGASNAKANLSSFHGTLTNQNGTIAEIKTLTKDDYAYLYLGDIYNKIIKVDANTSFVNANIDRTEQLKAAKIVINKTQPLLTNFVDESKIKESTVKKKIKESKKKYKKITYSFTYSEISKYIAKEYLEDESIIQALTVLLEKDEAGVKKELQEVINSNTISNEKIILNAYKRPFSTKTEAVEISVKTNSYVETTSKYLFIFNKDKVDFSTKVDDEIVYTGSISTTEFIMNDTNGILSIELKYGENDISGSYNVTIQDQTLSFNFSSKNEDDKILSTAQLIYNGMEISFKNELNILKDAKVDEFDTTYAITADQIPYEEQQYMSEQILNKMNMITNDLVTVQYRKTSDFTDITNIFNKEKIQ